MSPRRGTARRFAAWLLLALLCLIALSACVGASARTHPGTTETIDLDGRPFSLYVPEGAGDEPQALVLALHGYAGSAKGALSFFGLRDLADTHGFLVAAPQGTRDSDGKAFWNASSACCDFDEIGVDDSAYLSRVIERVVSTYRVDPGRVYVIGHSNGGFMAYRLACDHADQVVAIASVAGAMDLHPTCEPQRPVSVVQIHGDDDTTISYQGDPTGRHYTSARQTVALWRRYDGCPQATGSAGEPLDADVKVPGNDLTPTLWSNCLDGTEVALWRIDGGTHTPALTGTFNATLIEWLESHRRTAA